MFDHSFHFEGGCRNPFILDVVSYKQVKPHYWEIVFDGYWYLEPETFPVKRILKYFNGPSLFVEVIERTTIHNDPINGTEDEPTLFPTARIKIAYNVLSELKTEQDKEQANNALETLEKDDLVSALPRRGDCPSANFVGGRDEELRDSAHRIARELKEREELLRYCETLDYSKVTDFMKD
jgi:hypothetical protein